MKALLYFVILAFVAPALAQQPDRWKGLIIDQSSPEDAIAALAKPDEDKTDSFRVYSIDRWLTKSIREKKYRRLEFKTVEGFDKVILAFSDNKLVFIELNPKKLEADAFSRAYGIEMRPQFSGIDEAMNPKDFYRDNGKTYAKSYPTVYHLVGVSETTFVVGGVGNSSFGSVFKKSIGVPDSGSGYPGKILYVQIVSRSLENKDAANILK